MNASRPEGVPGGDFDYEAHGHDYASQRRPDPRIARVVHDALGEARTVVNVGAGAGSYEPPDRLVVAVEPSATMHLQRASSAAPGLRAIAEALPFADATFDAATAMVTVHQWGDLAGGVAELRRVSKGPIAILTFDPQAFTTYWLHQYAPEITWTEQRRFPTVAELCRLLGDRVRIIEIPTPAECSDGFGEAFYGRPERLLDPAVRAAQSAWGFLDSADVARFEHDLGADLASGAWDARYGHLRDAPSYDGALRLVVARG